MTESTRRADLAVLLIAGLCLGGFWAWTAPSDPTAADSVRFASYEYYPSMVEGWLQGRLDLPLTVAPGLSSLADPLDPVANAPYRYAGEDGVHDLSLYRGRLYMYWGSTPALLAFLPWRLLTGGGLDTAWAVWFFVLVGWLFSSCFLLLLARQHFPRAGLASRVAVVLVAGGANFAIAVLHRPVVYEVPIAAAYACMSLVWWQLAAALGRTPSLRQVPAAIASLAFGLAVAARPSWGVVWPLLLVVLWGVRDQWRQRSFRRLAACALGPALVCLLGILLLNYARFDDPLEFGQRYQLMSTRLPEASFVPRHIPSSALVYLFAKPEATDYFPFLATSTYIDPDHRRLESVLGMVPLLPILCTALLLPLAWRIRGLRRLSAVLVLCFVVMLGLLSSFHFGVVLRYAMDLAPTLALLAALGLLAGERQWPASTLAGRVFHALWTLGLVATFALTFLAACSLRPELSASSLSRIKLWANTVAYHAGWSSSAIQRLELEVVLPDDTRAQPVEVLAATGMTNLYANMVYLRRDGSDMVVGFKGSGPNSVESDPFAVDFAVPHTLALELGSFYPPEEHPYWDRIPRAESLRSRVRVEFDGEIVLDANVPQWGSVNAEPVLGYLPMRSGGAYRFSGTVLRADRHWVTIR